MWRFANQVYRAFRNSATHRCQQDILLPFPTACAADDEKKSSENRQIPVQYDINDVLKQNQFSPPDLEKIQNCLTNFAIQQFVNNCAREKLSKPIDEKNNVVKFDEISSKTIGELSEIHRETLAEIHLQMAVDALDAGDLTRGVQLLELSVSTSRNASAFYNLGLCYEDGLGVEQNRDKASEFYRQASLLGHVDAQLNLTRLSNHIDLRLDDDDDEQSFELVKELSRSPPSGQHRVDSIDLFDEDLSFSGFASNLKSSTAVCLSV